MSNYERLGNKFPYVTDDTLMIYTLKRYVQHSMFIGETFQLMEDAFKDIDQVSVRVTNQLYSINKIAEQKVQSICNQLGLPKISDKKQMITEVLKIFNQNLQDTLKEVKSLDNNTKDSIINLNKEIDKNRDLILKQIPKDISNLLSVSKFRTVISHKIVDGQLKNGKALNKYIKDYCITGIQDILIKEFGKLGDFKKSAVSFTNLEKALKESTINYETDAGILLDRKITTLKHAVQKDIKKFMFFSTNQIIENYVKYLVNIINNINDDEIKVKGLDKVLKDIDTIAGYKRSVVSRLGSLFEFSSALSLAALQVRDKDGKIMASKEVGLEEERIKNNDVTDLVLSWGNYKINVSIKSNSAPKNFSKDIVSKEKNTFIDTQVKQTLNNPHVKFFILSDLAVYLNRNEHLGFFDLLGRLRYEYGRLLAIKVILGSLFSDVDMSTLEDGMLPGALGNYEDFPIFLNTPQGTVLTTDIINSMIESFGGPTALYKDDKKVAAVVNSNAENNILKNFKELYKLGELGYSYNELYKYNDPSSNYKEELKEREVQNPDLFKHSGKGYPYTSADLEEAFAIMSRITELATSENLFNLITSGIEVFAKREVNQILKDDYGI